MQKFRNMSKVNGLLSKRGLSLALSECGGACVSNPSSLASWANMDPAHTNTYPAIDRRYPYQRSKHIYLPDTRHIEMPQTHPQSSALSFKYIASQLGGN